MGTAAPVYIPALPSTSGGISQLTWDSGTETLKLIEDTVDVWSVQQSSGATTNQMLLRGADGTGGLILDAVNGNGFQLYNRNAVNIKAQIVNTQISLEFGGYTSIIDGTGYHLNIGGADAFSVDANRNVIVGSGALATTATAGFLMITACAGVPTGVVAVPAGRVALVWNSTANALYADDGGGWGLV